MLTVTILWLDDIFYKTEYASQLNEQLIPFFFLTVLVGRVFASGLGDLGSIPGRVIPKN